MRKKIFIVATVAEVFDFFRGYLSFVGKRFDVCAISSDKEELETVGREEGIRTHYIFMKRPISIVFDFIALWKFVFLFLKEKPDILHSSSPKGSMLSMLAGRVTGVKSRIYSCMGLRYQGARGIKKRILMWMEQLTCYCASEVICVSNGVKNTLVANGLCAAAKVKIIGYGSVTGIDTTHFKADPQHRNELREKLGIPGGVFVFLFIGRIVGDKGVNELIQAFIELSVNEAPYLVLVGSEEKNLDPVSAETLMKMVEHPKIIRGGQQADVRPYLTAADALVLPTYREGFGMVLVEAGAMDLPCITTDILGCNEIIENEKNGLIIPPKDVTKLREAMMRMMDDQGLYERMKKNARPMVASRYEQSFVWDALISEYERLLRQRMKTVRVDEI